MQIKINVEGAQERRESFKRLGERQIPFATSLAINNSLKATKKDIIDLLPVIFDKPVRFTLNSLAFYPANKHDFTASLGFREWVSKGTPAVKYLQAQVYGGKRKPKRYEKALMFKGIMKPGQFTIPAKKYRNKNGNVSASSVVQMLSSLQAFSEVGYLANATNRRNKSKFFVMERSPGHKIIYKRVGRGGRSITPFMFITDDVHYAKHFNFDKIASDLFYFYWPKEIEKAIDYAISTAR